LFNDIIIVKRTLNVSEDEDSMWEEMTTHIQEVAIEVFGVTRGNTCKFKNSRWWNGDV
jgi:hypothetical protein